MSGSSPPWSPLGKQTSQPVEPSSIQRAAAAAGPKSASSGWAAMTMKRAGRQAWAVSAGLAAVMARCSRGAGGAFLGERREDGGRVTVGLHRRPGPGDPAVRVDEVRRSADAHVRLAVVRLLAPRAIARRDVLVDVGQQRERQVELLAETPVAGRAVRADAPHIGSGVG